MERIPKAIYTKELREEAVKLITEGGFYNGPQNLDSVISYTWEIKGGGPSGTNAKEVSAFI
jgi:hypothetical protein